MDIVIVITYFIIVLAIGITVSYKESLEGYFVNNRKTKLHLLIFTIISTGVGGGAIIGLVSMAYEKGILAFIFGILFAIGLFLTAILSGTIKKIGDKYKCHTVSDFLAIRYSIKCKLAGGIVYLSTALFIMAAQFLALSTFIHGLLGWSSLISILVSVSIVVIYTSLSGLRGVFYTDFIQFFIIVIAFIFILTPIIINKAGGLTALRTLPPEYFKIDNESWKLIIGGFIFLVPAFTMGMDFWQRIFAADSIKTAKKSFLISAIIAIPIYLVITLIGMYAHILLSNKYPLLSSEMASVQIIKFALPVGLRGLCLAAFISVLMSTADSMLMVASTVLLKDFYLVFKKKDIYPELLLRNSRYLTFFIGLFSLCLAIIVPNIINLIIMAISYLSILLPSIIGGFFWNRSNTKASFYSIILGFIIAVIFIFINPRFAFIPATLTSFIIFISFSYIFKHSIEEKVNVL